MGESHRISIHKALGGGSVADVLLWRIRRGAIVLLASSTAFWFLFERAGYNILSFASNVLLLLVLILFFWAKSASLLNRPLPPLPDLRISESSVTRIADVMQVWVNRALSIAHDIAIRRNLKLFLETAVVLWLISYIGSLFNFFTLIYIAVLFSLSVPVLYDKYQDHIDAKVCTMNITFQTQYRKIDNCILRKIPFPSYVKKKTQWCLLDHCSAN